MKILLQHKIFIGYFLLMAIIGSMVAIVLHERNRVQKIEDESIAIFQTQYDINTAHRYVTADIFISTNGRCRMYQRRLSSMLMNGNSMTTKTCILQEKERKRHWREGGTENENQGLPEGKE